MTLPMFRQMPVIYQDPGLFIFDKAINFRFTKELPPNSLSALGCIEQQKHQYGC
jgi:hypothetical protein